MNPDTTPTSSGPERKHSHGYASSGSESRKAGSSSGKKRASRAGTRSVTTLSAAQLERKRANDREAQRAIRQRTKDHIDHLERSISDLRSSQESNEKLVVATQQRNRELEEENAYLRNRLNEAGYAVNVPQPEGELDRVLSESSVRHSVAGSTPRSLSVTTASQSSSSRHGSFQQQGVFVPAAASAPLPVPSPSTITSNLNLTVWRSHDGTTSVPSTHAAGSQHVQERAQAHSAPSYAQTNPLQRVEWGLATQQYQYPVKQEQSPQQPYDAQHQHLQHQLSPPLSAHQSPYVQAPVQAYTTAPPPPSLQAHTYNPPQMPPQAEFQNMAVPSPSSYQIPQQTAYQQPQQPQAYEQAPQAQPYQQPPPLTVPQYQKTPSPQPYQQLSSYQMTPVRAQPPATGYASPHGQMHPPPVPASGYQPPTSGQHYTPQQQMHRPMQYREDPQGRSYALTHYLSG